MIGKESWEIEEIEQRLYAIERKGLGRISLTSLFVRSGVITAGVVSTLLAIQLLLTLLVVVIAYFSEPITEYLLRFLSQFISG